MSVKLLLLYKLELKTSKFVQKDAKQINVPGTKEKVNECQTLGKSY